MLPDSYKYSSILAQTPKVSCIDARIDILSSRVIRRVTPDVILSLGLIYPHPVNKHPRREHQMLPINPPKVRRYSQVHNQILRPKKPHQHWKQNRTSEKGANQRFLGYRSRSDLDSRVGCHSGSANGPGGGTVADPSDVSVSSGFVLEAVDGEAPPALSIAVLSDKPFSIKCWL